MLFFGKYIVGIYYVIIKMYFMFIGDIYINMIYKIFLDGFCILQRFEFKYFYVFNCIFKCDVLINVYNSNF